MFVIAILDFWESIMARWITFADEQDFDPYFCYCGEKLE